VYRAAEIRDRQIVLSNDDRGILTRAMSFSVPPSAWLGQWTTQAEGALAQACAAVAGAQAAAESEVRVRGARVAALERFLATSLSPRLTSPTTRSSGRGDATVSAGALTAGPSRPGMRWSGQAWTGA